MLCCGHDWPGISESLKKLNSGCSIAITGASVLQMGLNRPSLLLDRIAFPGCTIRRVCAVLICNRLKSEKEKTMRCSH